MARNEANIRAYGDLSNGVYIAPLGTVMPTDFAAPASPWKEMGWLGEDGISASSDISSETFKAFQGATIVRKLITENTTSFVVTALESNDVVRSLRFRGAETVTAAGVSTTVVKNQTANDERAFVLDFKDGDKQLRYLLPKASHELSGEVTYSNSGITQYEFTIQPIGDWTVIESNETP